MHKHHRLKDVYPFQSRNQLISFGIYSEVFEPLVFKPEYLFTEFKMLEIISWQK